jgi:hypothetical protein
MNTGNLPKSIRSYVNKKSLKTYIFIFSTPLYLYHSMVAKDVWTILFISCLALYVPLLWCALALYLCVKGCFQFKKIVISEKENIQNEIVHCVELNHLENLMLAIDANPEILYCDYQRRSLIAWCRYYKNTRAQELIIQMMKKYPPESRAA